MVRFGILGFGLHGVKRLMPGFALAKNCCVTALSRRDITKAQESARQFNIPQAFDSAEQLCRSPEVDAVFVTTPNACHLRDVLLALECGKPVLCEKPMAISADESRQMVLAARKANLLLGVAQVFRFLDSTARLRERVAAGQIGLQFRSVIHFVFRLNSHRISVAVAHQAWLQLPQRIPSDKIRHRPSGAIPRGDLSDSGPLTVDQS